MSSEGSPLVDDKGDESKVVFYEGAPRVIRKAKRSLRTPAPFIRRNAVYFKDTSEDNENVSPHTPYVMWQKKSESRKRATSSKSTPSSSVELSSRAEPASRGEPSAEPVGSDTVGGGPSKRRALFDELKDVLKEKKSDQEFVNLFSKFTLSEPIIKP